jgi:Flp pilus assembly protein TadG
MDTGVMGGNFGADPNQRRGGDMKRLTGKAVNFARAIRSCRGQSLVEFAMVAPLFFLLVFGITDFARLFFTQETLQYAVREAGRYAVTGQHMTQGSNTLSRVASIQQVIQQNAMGINVSNISISSGGLTNTVGAAGGPRQTVVVSVTDSLHLITPMIGRFFPNQTYTFTVSTSFMNEPFNPTQTD